MSKQETTLLTCVGALLMGLYGCGASLLPPAGLRFAADAGVSAFPTAEVCPADSTLHETRSAHLRFQLPSIPTETDPLPILTDQPLNPSYLLFRTGPDPGTNPEPPSPPHPPSAHPNSTVSTRCNLGIHPKDTGALG